MSKIRTALVLTAALLVPACSLPVNSEVDTLPREEYEELLDGTTTTTTVPVEPADPDSKRVTLYFVGPDDKLERVVRSFPDGTVKNQVLSALGEEPLVEEVDELGLETLITQLPAGLGAQLGPLVDGTQIVTVEPEGDLRNIVDQEPLIGRLIVSQLVCTVLSLPSEDDTEVSGIEITDGQEEPIPLSDINAEPLVRAANKSDFNDCRTGADERAEAEAEAESESEPEETTTTVP